MLKGCGHEECLGSQKHRPRLFLGQAPLCPGVCPRQGSSLAPACISFLPWLQICQIRAGPGSRVERRSPVALVNLEVSGEVQEWGKDSVCISQLMLDHAAVINVPGPTGSRTGTPTGSRTELDLSLASRAGDEPGKRCTLSFWRDTG